MKLSAAMVGAITILCTVGAVANGWGSGLNAIPVCRVCTVEDQEGNTRTLLPGTPIYLRPDRGWATFWAHWDDKPRERQVHIDRDALPDGLETFGLYRQRDFVKSAALFQEEAASESNPLVQSWKYILAGHATLMAEPGTYEAAIRLYQRAWRNASNVFQPAAVYFEARALMRCDKHAEAYARLGMLKAVCPSGTFRPPVFFTTYPEHCELTAWSTGARIRVLDEAMDVLGGYMTCRREYEALDDGDSDEEAAEKTYQYARAKEALWNVFPDEFFDWPRPPGVEAMLQRVFTDYPDTEAGSKAYYEWLRYQQYVDFDGERVEWEQQQRDLIQAFLERYPDSPLAVEARERLEAAEAYLEECKQEPPAPDEP